MPPQEAIERRRSRKLGAADAEHGDHTPAPAHLGERAEQEPVGDLLMGHDRAIGPRRKTSLLHRGPSEETSPIAGTEYPRTGVFRHAHPERDDSTKL